MTDQQPSVPREDFSESAPPLDLIDTGSQNVTGYRKHTQQQIDAVNTTKDFENDLGDWFVQLRDAMPDQLDERWVETARTHFQQGFMALNRAVFQPESRL